MWPAGQLVWFVPHQTARVHTSGADCSTHVSDQTDSTLFPPLSTSVQSSSPHGSNSSSHSTAISISPKRTGRSRGLRYHSASQHKLASSIQGNLSFHSFKYKKSPAQIAAENRQAQAAARGTIATCMHVGASLLGKCIGASPHPDAQAKALETLLQQQNPANWTASLAKQKQVAVEQQVRRLAETCCPDLQQHLPQLQQVTAFEVLPEARQRHEAVLADIKASLEKTMADQAATAEVNARREAAATAAAVSAAAAAEEAEPETEEVHAHNAEMLTQAATVEDNAQCEAAAAAVSAAVSAAAAEEAEPKTGEVQADFAEMLESAAAAHALAEALTACGAQDGSLPELAFAADKVAAVIAGIQAASHTLALSLGATTEGSQPEAAAMSPAETAMTDMQVSAGITAECLPELSSTNFLGTPQPEDLIDQHFADATLSDDSSDLLTRAQSSENIRSEPKPLQFLTKADMQLVMDYARESSNCAYGRQAEHAMIQEFELKAQQAQHAQHGNYTWHKMGAPEYQELGVYNGITCELGCQVDRALCNLWRKEAIPVEFKNRKDRFPAKLLEHERVQVQAQLQLCDAPMGVLVERLQLPNGKFDCRWHELVRDDRQWYDDIMPALHKFMAVVANMATVQDELDMYLSKRASNQHHSYLRHLLRQQVDCGAMCSC